MASSENNNAHKKTLIDYRKEINTIDSRIIDLLARRQDIASEIGRIKRENGLEILDVAREAEVFSNLVARAGGNLSGEAIRAVFNEIISASRSVQEPLNVAFLGPEASFSHQAAISLFGHSAEFKSAESLEEVFSLVEKGICQQGLIPIENSFEGSINSSFDLLHKYGLKINAEVSLRIRHHLLSKTDDIKKIKVIYSHPMAIAQCMEWIRINLSDVKISDVSSTSLAAKMVALGSEDAASVGNILSARMYNLKLLAENIETHPDNVTRFLSIGKLSPESTGNDKTSILFFLDHRPGALFKMLGILAEKNINMTRIESRPMRIKNWEYMFFVDLDGHEDDENVKQALIALEECCLFFKRLGSYPAAGIPLE